MLKILKKRLERLEKLQPETETQRRLLATDINQLREKIQEETRFKERKREQKKKELKQSRQVDWEKIRKFAR